MPPRSPFCRCSPAPWPRLPLRALSGTGENASSSSIFRELDPGTPPERESSAWPGKWKRYRSSSSSSHLVSDWVEERVRRERLRRGNLESSPHPFGAPPHWRHLADGPASSRVHQRTGASKIPLALSQVLMSQHTSGASQELFPPEGQCEIWLVFVYCTPLRLLPSEIMHAFAPLTGRSPADSLPVA